MLKDSKEEFFKGFYQKKTIYNYKSLKCFAELAKTSTIIIGFRKIRPLSPVKESEVIKYKCPPYLIYKHRSVK